MPSRCCTLYYHRKNLWNQIKYQTPISVLGCFCYASLKKYKISYYFTNLLITLIKVRPIRFHLSDHATLLQLIVKEFLCMHHLQNAEIMRDFFSLKLETVIYQYSYNFSVLPLSQVMYSGIVPADVTNWVCFQYWNRLDDFFLLIQNIKNNISDQIL